MFAFATAFLQPGDEVILFEPCSFRSSPPSSSLLLTCAFTNLPVFDQYIAQVNFNGGTPVFVPIRPPANASTSNVSAKDWKVDLNELRAAITPKTKMIWINTPHNPIGKVGLRRRVNERQRRGRTK